MGAGILKGLGIGKEARRRAKYAKATHVLGDMVNWGAFTYCWRICEICPLMALWSILGWELHGSDLFCLFLWNRLIHGYLCLAWLW